ncbi:Atxe2 family lasso peptide isopeptidase [Sphingobium sp. H39-3-25]|uniref:Atxe2 family lasso peptide isopeptidase n=1 Tax=Sphingobium arseniciresistens TaxID=3030834 RepID=UPI0023B9AF93|nr:Atxe2 family lasso peptide isopeptidase [Sphingobium arseniciresistens]
MRPLIAMGLASFTLGFACMPSTSWAAGDCNGFLSNGADGQATGPVTAEILATLRDIGPSYPDRRRELFTISPDKRYAAFQIHRADPARNAYCVGLMMVGLSPGSETRLLDVGGELILDATANYGWAEFPLGAPATVTPRWAPNGKWIAYLKRVNGTTQVWRVDVQGGYAVQVTHAPVDVDDFRITPDGRSIIYAARPALAEKRAAIERESLSGWHYDDRAFPARGARPQTPASDRQYMTVELDRGASHLASPSEAALVAPIAGVLASRIAYSSHPDGSEAWAERERLPVFPPNYRLVINRGKQALTCQFSACQLDMSASLWWSDDGKVLRFSRREGWAQSLTAIYEWRPGRGAPRPVLLTSDELFGCQPVAADLVCLRERSREPRHFVRYGFGKKKEVRLYDPNPEFSSRHLGRVERLNWRNEMNVPFYGDIVYPLDYEAGRRFPLIVVQYRTRGFLRGGIGDEFPIQSFAGRGYFVLVVDNLNHLGVIAPQKSAEAWTTSFNKNFNGRRNILSAVEAAVGSLIDKGLVDSARIGITGLSDGSTTVQFAAINSTLFSAASVGDCCWEPGQDVTLGPTISQGYHERGWPRLVDHRPDFWSSISWAEQPARVRMPVLIQAADNEYLSALASVTALKQVGTPVDLFIFPNENHVKSEPAHRLALYRRNIAWFDFWLKDIVPEDRMFMDEATRWQRMREAWRNAPQGAK